MSDKGTPPREGSQTFELPPEKLAPAGGAPTKEIVTELRRMTGVGTAEYTIGEHDYWADADLEALLERRICARLTQVQVELIPSLSEAGIVEALAGFVRVPGSLDTETTEVFTFTGAKLEGATVRPDGRIDFAQSALAEGPLLSGTAYDLNGAAADLLTEWASQLKLDYNFSAGGQSLQRNQRYQQMLAQAEEFRRRAVVTPVKLRRSDSRPAGQKGSTGRRVLRAFEWLGNPG